MSQEAGAEATPEGVSETHVVALIEYLAQNGFVICSEGEANLGGKVRLEHAGVWDPPHTSDRVTVYYEDESRPDGAIPLYRATPIGKTDHG